MSNYKRVDRVLIGKGSDAGATILPGIQKGELYLLDENNAIVATNAAAAALPKFSKVSIAMGTGDGTFIKSSPIDGSFTSHYEGKATVAPSEKVTFLGYDGTNGVGINADADTEYRLRTRILDDNRPHGQRATLSDVNYSTGTATTAGELASAIACLYTTTEYGFNFIGDLVKLERVSDGTFAALSATASVVKKSKFVISTGHGLTDTGYIRIGGTTTTTPVYGFKVVDANTLELDVPYQGVTNGAMLAANIGGLSTITKWGFKQTGLAQDSRVSRAANEPLDEYQWIEFVSAFTDADDLATSQYSAIEYVSAEANPGQGFWKQVADQEEFAKAYLGDTDKINYYATRIASNVDVAVQYDSVIISHAASFNGDFQGTMTAPLKTQIYLPDGSDQGLNSGNNFLHVLNGFFASSVGFTAIAF